jgi:hypothetical protein
MDTLIASSIPGRLRLRHAALRNPHQLERLRAATAGWQGVLAVATNPRAGSLLIRYDPVRLETKPCEQRALAAVAEVLGLRPVTAGPTRRHAGRPGGLPRVKVNRWAKRGMLASLALSLALAAMGHKSWHALVGIAFLHGLAVHLWIHRQRLLR